MRVSALTVYKKTNSINTRVIDLGEDVINAIFHSFNF